MRLFKKALAFMILVVYLLYLLLSPFVKNVGPDLSRNKEYDGYLVSMVMPKQAIAGENTSFGYFFEEDKNKTEAKGVYYAPTKEIEIYKDGKLTANSSYFGYLNQRALNKPSLEMKYLFKEPGIYEIRSYFIAGNKTINSDFLVEVKTKEKYEQDRLRGALLLIVVFVIIAVILIYIYEKMERPKKKEKGETNKKV